MKDDLRKVQRTLIHLYLTVKIRKKEEAENITEEILKEEEEQLKKQNLLTLVEYIKSSIDVLVSLKVEEQLALAREDIEEDNEYAAEHYETLLKKLESDIRQHISIEHQLKIHAEKLADHIEDLERENKTVIKQLEKYKKSRKTEEQMNEEMNNMKQVLKSYEEQNFKLNQNEKKLKTQLVQKDKDIKHLEKKILSRTSLMNQSNSHSINISMCSHSRSKSILNEDERKDKQNSIIKKSPIPIEKMKNQDKIEEYRRLIDKKIQDISKHKLNRSSREKSLCANVSLLSKERSIDNDLTTISKRNEELTQRLNELTYKVIGKEECKKSSSMKKLPESKKDMVLAKKKSNKIIVNKLLKKTPRDIPIVINHSDFHPFNNLSMYTNNDNSSNSNVNNFDNKSKIINKVDIKEYISSRK